MKLIIFSTNIKNYISNFRKIIKNYKLEKSGYKYSLADVTSGNDGLIKLQVIVWGIKKQIILYNPEEILFDDDLLSEFSPCDIRAITYLSFHKYIDFDVCSLEIEGQYIDKGKTIFKVRILETRELILLGAKQLYEDYDLLTKLKKKDMINVISTAVQEQTFIDTRNMDLL